MCQNMYYMSAEVNAVKEWGRVYKKEIFKCIYFYNLKFITGEDKITL